MAGSDSLTVGNSTRGVSSFLFFVSPMREQLAASQRLPCCQWGSLESFRSLIGGQALWWSCTVLRSWSSWFLWVCWSCNKILEGSDAPIDWPTTNLGLWATHYWLECYPVTLWRLGFAQPHAARLNVMLHYIFFSYFFNYYKLVGLCSLT